MIWFSRFGSLAAEKCVIRGIDYCYISSLSKNRGEVLISFPFIAFGSLRFLDWNFRPWTPGCPERVKHFGFESQNLPAWTFSLPPLRHGRGEINLKNESPNAIPGTMGLPPGSIQYLLRVKFRFLMSIHSRHLFFLHSCFWSLPREIKISAAIC